MKMLRGLAQHALTATGYGDCNVSDEEILEAVQSAVKRLANNEAVVSPY